ncbi:MAG: NUDIX domain-containing protein [Acidimicrobiia bacterium]|nr:NUDIX domain-containing protein [Acidimicrobiia bacterium]
MTGRYEMWDGSGPVTVGVPVSGGENVMVPVVRAVVRPPGDADQIILQRRDEPGESVAGLFELPGGRWHAGEDPAKAIAREVAEETGLRVVTVAGVAVDRLDERRGIATVRPLAVTAGVEGAFPAAHMILVVDAVGEPRAEPGESADVRWWSLDAVRSEMARNRAAFIPSSFAALEAYVAWIDDPHPA